MSEKAAGERLRARLQRIPGLVEGRSRFNREHVAWTAGGREIAHLHTGESLDVRLPRAEQQRLEGEPFVLPRPRASEWMEIKVESEGDVRRAVALVRIAAGKARRA